MIKLDKYGAFLHIFPETNPFGWDEFRPILCWGSTLGLAIERWTPQKNRPKRCRPDTWCPGGGSARQKKIRHVGDSWNQMPCHMPYKSTCNQHRHWEFCFLKQHLKQQKYAIHCDSTDNETTNMQSMHCSLLISAIGITIHVTSAEALQRDALSSRKSCLNLGRDQMWHPEARCSSFNMMLNYAWIILLHTNRDVIDVDKSNIRGSFSSETMGFSTSFWFTKGWPTRIIKHIQSHTKRLAKNRQG